MAASYTPKLTGNVGAIFESIKVIAFFAAIIFILYFISKIISNADKGVSNIFGSGGVSEIKKAINVAENEGQESYYNDATLKGYADSIYTMLEHGGWFENLVADDDEQGVVDIMLQMRTTGDVQKVALYLRKDYGLSLQSIIRDELYPEQVAEINAHFKQNGIVFTL